MSQAIRTKKLEVEENTKLKELIDFIYNKYNISNDIILKTIDPAKTEYKLQFYKINVQEIDYEIEAIKLNEKTDNITPDTIKEALNNIIERAEKDYEENNNNNKANKKNIPNRETSSKNLLMKPSSDIKNDPSKNNVIPTNSKINVKYTTTIMYNIGSNDMEKKFNIENPTLNESLFQTIDSYDLLPKDQSGQNDGYEKYFIDIRKKLLDELKVIPDDTLLGISKFVLFVAFDVIDARPTFDDLVGIDPLNDYKKYILKINTNMNNIFLVSGQIIYIEGNLIENGTTIEVRDFKNGFEINEYSINYEQINYFYQRSLEPYAIYSMNGPYFSKDILNLTVFKKVIHEVASKNPHFFIVNGPFFSTENEKIKWGDFDTEEGMKIVINLLKEEFKNARTKILICPGISDVENFYPVPQPPFDKVNDSFTYLNRGGQTEIIFISNPQIIPINEAFLGVANFDSIKDIIFNSIHSPQINTVDKACEMILYQKNFYPILPNTLQQNYEIGRAHV